MAEAVEALRMDITKIAPDVYKHLLAIEQEVARHVEPKLHHLLKLRASQINEIGWLTLVGTMINAWNRIAISSRGQYDRKLPEQTTAAAANDRVAEPA